MGLFDSNNETTRQLLARNKGMQQQQWQRIQAMRDEEQRNQAMGNQLAGQVGSYFGRKHGRDEEYNLAQAHDEKMKAYEAEQASIFAQGGRRASPPPPNASQSGFVANQGGAPIQGGIVPTQTPRTEGERFQAMGKQLFDQAAQNGDKDGMQTALQYMQFGKSAMEKDAKTASASAKAASSEKFNQALAGSPLLQAAHEAGSTPTDILKLKASSEKIDPIKDPKVIQVSDGADIVSKQWDRKSQEWVEIPNSRGIKNTNYRPTSEMMEIAAQGKFAEKLAENRAGNIGDSEALDMTAGDMSFESAPLLARNLELLEEIETGGFDGVALKFKKWSGTTTANESELMNSMGKSIIKQIKPLFGGQPSLKEGEWLQRIEASEGMSTPGAKRLMKQGINLAIDRVETALGAAKAGGDLRKAKRYEKFLKEHKRHEIGDDEEPVNPDVMSPNASKYL
ncbi:MAG: hypothetical protein JKY52_20920 [Flavobacteriales bacterium]|nr:hypothetical protein [Flavobacteriales bacterium]